MEEAALYNKIGVEYDKTRRADEFLTKRFRRFLSPAENENYLDVGCGTGNYTCALAGGEYRFYGIDPSEMMLAKARQRNCNVIWQNGDAGNLPFENEFFGGAIAGLTIHHWKDLKKAFGEIHRVLKQSGRFVLFTSLPEQMEGYWLNHYFPEMMRDSIEQMPAFSKVKDALQNAGFEIETLEKYFVRDDLRDYFLYCGKHRPELYLREEIRRGISSFSSLANKDEVESGLQKLTGDIEEGKISEIIKNHQNNKGDYIFIVAKKSYILEAIMTEQNPLGLKKIHHVEFYVGNAKQAEFYYRKAFGFSRIAYSGLETGNRETTSYVLRQNRVNFVLTTPLTPEHAAAEHIKQHGDGVRDIAFQVEDADHAFNEAVKRGAKAFIEPHDWKDEFGTVRKAAIHTYGDTIHSFISYGGNPRVSEGVNGNGVQPSAAADGSDLKGHNYNGVFLPGFTEQNVAGEDVGIVLVDHIVGNVELGKMNFWCDFYRDVMGFERYITFDDKDISTEYSALMSIVMSDGGHNIKFPINEPAEGKGGKSQIQEYIDFYRSAGAQHVALLCKDIRESVAKLQANGIEFLRVPDTYYDEIPTRVGEIDEDIEDLKRLGILVDRDDEGYLLQIFTKPVEDRPTVFYEILQRKGCKGFGKGNFKALFVSIEEEQRRRGNL